MSQTNASLPRFRSLVRLGSGISMGSSKSNLTEVKVNQAEAERQKKER